MATATYNFSDYLSQINPFNRKDSSTLLTRAKAAANLLYDPQKQEANRQAKLDELQSITNTQKIKRANAGVDESLAYNNAQAKKAAAIRAAGSGAIGSSGLTDYLNNEADTATQAQRMNIAATLAGNLTDEASRYQGVVDNTNQTLSDIETNRGTTSETLYNQYEDAQDAAETAWDTNALSIALGIGSGVNTAADINMRQANAAAALKEQRYEADLPYKALTQYQKGTLDLDTTKTMGRTPNSVRNISGDGSITYDVPSGGVGLRQYAEAAGKSVGYDSSTGNISVGNKTLTSTDLKNMGGYIGSNGRWVIPQSAIASIM